jgi:hypothetical protein
VGGEQVPTRHFRDPSLHRAKKCGTVTLTLEVLTNAHLLEKEVVVAAGSLKVSECEADQLARSVSGADPDRTGRPEEVGQSSLGVVDSPRLVSRRTVEGVYEEIRAHGQVFS